MTETAPYPLICVPMQRTCNNMFQIASCWTYCLDRGYKLLVDTAFCPTAADLLHELGDPFETASAVNKRVIQYRTLDPQPIPEMFDQAGNRVFDGLVGWFQDPRYYLTHEQEVRNLFRPLTGVAEQGVLGVHVRLGDFLSQKYLKDYFTLRKQDIEKSFSLLGAPKAKKIILFSDEPEKAKELLPWKEVVVSAATTPFETLRQMSSCEYLIASNATMSWWAAWLGKIKHVAVHYPWTKFHHQNGLYLPHWKVYSDQE